MFWKWDSSIPTKRFVDSAIHPGGFSDKDWAIRFFMDRAGAIPFYDSLGNIIYMEPEPFTTTVLYRLNNVYYLQKFRKSCYQNDTCFYISKRVKLPVDFHIDFTVDSIRQAQSEWIYEYIYKNKEGAFVSQPDSDHSPHYDLGFLTRDMNTSKRFSRICMEKMIFPDGAIPVNLNYERNINTFIYRSFIVLKELLTECQKLKLFD